MPLVRLSSAYSLTIYLPLHDVDSTVIPSTVTASVSIRIVPDQDLDTIAKALEDHLRTTFANMRSPNTIDVELSACRLSINSV